ncbi:MAG: T9SS type A sorting domain-containing protein [candidate division WOR-3 bacterium]|nr:MAG: T9SS type A sorting domain-containing protein [candidate division WOR-3 bacterium]
MVLNYTGTDPYVVCTAITVDDAAGNNNGRIDPGETVNLTATLKNVGGVDFTNLNTTLESSDPYITVTDNSGIFGVLMVDSAKENTGDQYVLSADVSTPLGHMAEFRLIATDAAFIDTIEFTLVVGPYHYMIWNPDPTPGPGRAVDSILTDLGYTGHYATTLLTESDLEIYRALFIFVGIYSNNHVIAYTDPEVAALVDYLTAGGNMYLEGGDVWHYDPLVSGYDFRPLFGIQSTADGSNDGGPFAGQSGTFTQEMYFQYGGENNFIDHISPSATGSFLIFRDDDQLYDCGVAYDAGTYKTVGLSFELGGLIDATGNSTRAALLDSIMHFFSITTGVEEVTKLDVTPLSLHLAPNPFSKLTTASFGIEESAESVELKIYDAVGRLVRNLYNAIPHAPYTMQVTWDGRDDQNRKLSSGVYFVKLSTEKQTATRKVILVD